MSILLIAPPCAAVGLLLLCGVVEALMAVTRRPAWVVERPKLALSATEERTATGAAPTADERREHAERRAVDHSRHGELEHA